MHCWLCPQCPRSDFAARETVKLQSRLAKKGYVVTTSRLPSWPRRCDANHSTSHSESCRRKQAMSCSTFKARSDTGRNSRTFRSLCGATAQCSSSAMWQGFEMDSSATRSCQRLTAFRLSFSESRLQKGNRSQGPQRRSMTCWSVTNLHPLWKFPSGTILQIRSLTGLRTSFRMQSSASSWCLSVSSWSLTCGSQFG